VIVAEGATQAYETHLTHTCASQHPSCLNGGQQRAADSPWNGMKGGAACSMGTGRTQRWVQSRCLGQVVAARTALSMKAGRYVEHDVANKAKASTYWLADRARTREGPVRSTARAARHSRGRWHCIPDITRETALRSRSMAVPATTPRQLPALQPHARSATDGATCGLYVRVTPHPSASRIHRP